MRTDVLQYYMYSMGTCVCVCVVSWAYSPHKNMHNPSTWCASIIHIHILLQQYWKEKSTVYAYTFTVARAYTSTPIIRINSLVVKRLVMIVSTGTLHLPATGSFISSPFLYTYTYKNIT